MYFILVINIKNSYLQYFRGKLEHIIIPSSSILFPTHNE